MMILLCLISQIHLPLPCREVNWSGRKVRVLKSDPVRVEVAFFGNMIQTRGKRERDAECWTLAAWVSILLWSLIG